MSLLANLVSFFSVSMSSTAYSRSWVILIEEPVCPKELL